MTPSPLPSPIVRQNLFQRLRTRTAMLARGGLNANNELQVGLLPQPGWSRRNYHFMRRVLLPSLWQKRGGEAQQPDLTHPDCPGKFQVTWIGHASFLIQTGGTNILVDPNWAHWLTVVKRLRHPGMSLNHLPRIDVVLITHAHHDHLHLRTLRRISNGQPIVVPHGVGKLVSRAGFGQVIEMERWQELEIAGLRITFTPSKHWGARHIHDVHRGFGGFLIKNHHGRTVYHCGDSAYFEGFAEIGAHSSIDLALLPIGAYEAMSGREVHMNPEEALAAFRDLGATHMAPMHYGTFPLGGEPVHEPLIRFKEGALSLGYENQISILTEGAPCVF